MAPHPHQKREKKRRDVQKCILIRSSSVPSLFVMEKKNEISVALISLRKRHQTKIKIRVVHHRSNVTLNPTKDQMAVFSFIRPPSASSIYIRKSKQKSSHLLRWAFKCARSKSITRRVKILNLVTVINYKLVSHR